MTTRRNFIKKTAAGLSLLAVNPSKTISSMKNVSSHTQVNFVSRRPKPSDRHFTSTAVENTINNTSVPLKPQHLWLSKLNL